MLASLSNPYYHLAAIRTDMFFGRTNLLRRFYAAIANRQCISLVGPRHIGKSSFLQCARQPEMQARFGFDQSRYIFVFLDLRKYLRKTCEDFFHLVGQEIIAQSRDVPGLTLHADGEGEDEFSRILEQIGEQRFFPVLLLDAFDNIVFNEHFDPEFFAFLRAQATMGEVSYVTATIVPLYEGHHRGIAGSPFFNIFHTYQLEAFTDDEARALIALPAQRVKMPFTEAEITWILKMAGRHPFFIQRVCYFLFEEKLIHSNGQIDERYIRKLVYNDLNPHFADTWENLSKTDQAILQDEAQQEENHSRKLPELTESALFRQFVLNISQKELFQINTQELEIALDKMNDPVALGETNLRLLKIVSQRLKKDMLPSTIEKSMVIREILNEAFERLHGNGSQADSASNWKLYNILYYRYFRYHLKNEQIAARLEFNSLRQYYRERNRAINALLDILLEMERAANNIANK